MIRLLKKVQFIHTLYLVLGLTIISEVYRLPILLDSGILLSDLLVPAIVATWILANLKKFKTFLSNQPKQFKWLFAFEIIALISLIQSLWFFDPKEVLAGAMYWLRFVSYSLLALITYFELDSKKAATNLIQVILLVSLIISAAGFVQLFVFPDLGSIVNQGWDPHINRLVSTWLDPNFIGGFLSFIFAISLGLALHMPASKKRNWLIIALAVFEVAIFFTYSRSAYLAFLAALIVVTIFKHKKILAMVLIVLALQISVSPYAQERVLSLSNQGTKDPTASLRIQSWLDAIQLTKEKPILGYGYNNMATIKEQKDILRSDSDHSASGSDSSLLTILATTGILGFITFFAFYLLTFIQAIRTRSQEKIPGLSLGLAGGISALFIHSIIVNSLLFPPIMIFFFITWGIYQWNVN